MRIVLHKLDLSWLKRALEPPSLMSLTPKTCYASYLLDRNSRGYEIPFKKMDPVCNCNKRCKLEKYVYYYRLTDE